jgi:hypothetical protein
MAELHMPHAPGAPGEHPAVRHEESDVNIRAIFAFGLALTIATIFLGFVVWILFTYFSSREARTVTPQYPLAAGQQNRLPPEPRLQTDPRKDLGDLRAQEDAVLNSYGWVDKNAGVVRIPIEEAMKIAVQRGLAARQERR